MKKRRKILYAVLDWGLGHATRSLPVIRELIKENDVTVLSTGRSLKLLRSELKDIEFIDHPDYSVKYTKRGGALLISLLLQVPKILYRLKEEHRFTEGLVKEHGFDRIISDNRYGIYSKEIPSFFITHQLRFKLPRGMGKLEILSVIFNKLYFRRYRKIFIPDVKEGSGLSGDLSHNIPGIREMKLCYTGLLADIDRSKDEIRSERLIIISGPEPQRSIFEKKAVEQSAGLEGKTIIVCGRTEKKEIGRNGQVEIYSYADRKELSAMMRGAGMVISRPGYSSVMEIVSLNKKAVFIPTPGQTEQEYLAEYFQRKGYFRSVPQKEMDLVKDISLASECHVPADLEINRTQRILEEILS